MMGLALELRGTGSVYEQFTCVVGRGGKSYTVEFDATLPNGGSWRSLSVGHRVLLRIDFGSNGSISGTLGTIGTFKPAEITRFRLEVDIVNDASNSIGTGFPSHAEHSPVRHRQATWIQFDSAQPLPRARLSDWTISESPERARATQSTPALDPWCCQRL